VWIPTPAISGERENGLYKDPIEMAPSADSGSFYLDPSSRIRSGKAHAIERNVNVKDLGMVVPHDIAKLVAFFKDEDNEVR
jgi:hypothetical protein